MIVAALFTRPARRRPLRFAMTCLGVAAGVASVVATLAASRAAVDALRAGVNGLAGSARLEVTRPGGVDESWLGQLRPLASDAILVPVIDELVLAPDARETVRLLGVDPLVDERVREMGDALRAGVARPRAEASFASLLEGRGAWVAEPLARELNLVPGATLALVVHARPLPITVLGLLPRIESTTAFDRVVVVDVALAQEWTLTVGLLDRIELVPRRGVVLADLKARALALVGPGARVVEPSVRADETAGLVRSLEFNLTALSGISLIVGAVLVATTLATSVVQRRRTLALLYALGASRGQVVGAILVEAGAIGLVGGVLGVALGFAGARWLTPSMSATVSTVVTTTACAVVRVSLDHALIGIALGLCASLAAAILPVLEGARTPPIQGLRGEAPERLSARSRRIAVALGIGLALIAVEFVQLPAWNGLPIAALLGSLAFLAALFFVFGPLVDAIGAIPTAFPRLHVSLRLACAGLSAGRRRAAWAAGAVGLAVALSIAIATMVTSFRESVVDWTGIAFQNDLSIRPPATRSGLPVGGLDPAILDRTRDAIGRDHVDPYFAAKADFRDQRITLAGVDFAVAAKHGGAAMLDGSDAKSAFELAAREHGMLANEAASWRFGLKVGDHVRIDVDGAPLERRIAGIFRDYGDSQGVFIVGEDDFHAHFPALGPRTIGVYKRASEDVRTLRERLAHSVLAEFQVEILDHESLRAIVLAVFERTFAITKALQGAATIVAVLAVLSVLHALVDERRADLALLTSIGAGGGQVRALVCIQAGILGLVGAAGGGFTGLVIGLVLVKVVNLQSFGWTLLFVQPWSTIATTALLVAAACLVSGAVPALAAAPARLRGALREE